MSRISLSILFIMLFVTTSSEAFQQEVLPLGSKAPLLDHKVDEVSGRSVTLNEVAQENGLIVIFSGNTCPWVIKWEDRYDDISQVANDNNIGLIALNANEDYRERGDGMEDMVKRARKAEYDFPYALDENHVLADAFGAVKTPHVYIFNSDLVLIYVGAIDDNPNDVTEVKEYYIKDAVDKMVIGENLSRTITNTLGCTIKRKG